jgi:hypothetical protein
MEDETLLTYIVAAQLRRRLSSRGSGHLLHIKSY